MADVQVKNITFSLKSQVHKCAQRLSTARYYESGYQIQNGVNTSTVILLKTKCLVRLTFRQLFFLGQSVILIGQLWMLRTKNTRFSTHGKSIITLKIPKRVRSAFRTLVRTSKHSDLSSLYNRLRLIWICGYFYALLFLYALYKAIDLWKLK